MSEDNRPPKVDGFFSVECDLLRLGTKLTFDCFMYLERNNRVVHWLRAGSVFTPNQVEKLDKFGRPDIFIMDIHADAFEKYSGVKVRPNTEKSFLPLKNPPGEIKHFKGQKTVPDPIHVFGKTIIKTNDGAKRISGSKIAAKTPEPPKAPKVNVDVDFINVVMRSTQAVLNDVCKVHVTFRPPSKRKDRAEYPIQVNLASFIGLNSQSIRGTVGLCFPEKTYLYLLSSATGMTFSELSSELALGAGEFMYHIFEASIPRLVELGYLIDHAVPFMFVGQDISIPHVLPDPGFSVLFDSPGGPFQFEIGIKTGN